MRLKALQLSACARVPKFDHSQRVSRDNRSITRHSTSKFRDRQKSVVTDPITPTVHTKVRSPRILSVPILSMTRPVETSHFLTLLSEPPVTNQVSTQSSSSSSSSLELFSFLVVASRFLTGRGAGGPHAMLKSLHFTRSNRRKWDRVSLASDKSRTVPSSQPRASKLEAGLAAMHQIEPPWELITLCYPLIIWTHCIGIFIRTLTDVRSISHSNSSLPPPALNNRRSEQDGTSSG
jgi:hypothetical protein